MIDAMTVQDWRRELRDLVARGVAAYGPDETIEHLTAETVTLGRSGAPALLQPPAPVLGVDACVTGWVGALLRPDGRVTVHVSARIETLVNHVRESVAPAVVAIDIPIGLPDSGGRQADALARQALPGKSSSVFSTLTRSAYAADTYAEGREANLEATEGASSASAQAWALAPKILQVDAWVRAGAGVAVIEVHPELCFARMAGEPILQTKRSPEGVALRRAALEQAGIVAPAWFSGSGFAEDDLLDACAAAWTAVRHLQRETESFPDPPEVFSDGIAAAIRV